MSINFQNLEIHGKLFLLVDESPGKSFKKVMESHGIFIPVLRGDSKESKDKDKKNT